MPRVPTTASLRKLLQHVLRADSDLDAFCLDSFSEVSKRFSLGMDRTQKLNILLNHEDKLEILEALCDYDPKRTERWQEKIKWEDSFRVAKVIPITRRRKRRIHEFLLGAVFADWARRVWVDLSPTGRTLALVVVAGLLSGLGVTQVLQRYYSSTPGRSGSTRPRQPPGALMIPPQILAWPDGGAAWQPGLLEHTPAPAAAISR